MDDKGKAADVLLKGARVFAYPAVIVLLSSIMVLLVLSFIKIAHIIRTFMIQEDIVDLQASAVSADLLSVMDLYLLIIAVYIMAIAIYKFFIGEIKIDLWLELNDLDDLKVHLAKVIVLFLIIFTVKKIVEWGNEQHIFYFGMITVLVCAVLIGYCMFLCKCRIERKNSKCKNGDDRGEPGCE